MDLAIWTWTQCCSLAVALIYYVLPCTPFKWSSPSPLSQTQYPVCTKEIKTTIFAGKVVLFTGLIHHIEGFQTFNMLGYISTWNTGKCKTIACHLSLTISWNMKMSGDCWINIISYFLGHSLVYFGLPDINHLQVRWLCILIWYPTVYFSLTFGQFSLKCLEIHSLPNKIHFHGIFTTLINKTVIVCFLKTENDILHSWHI